MKQTTMNTILGILQDGMDSGAARTALARMMRDIPEDEAEHLARDLAEMASYRDFLTEDEAARVTGEFTNHDGTRGAHWPDADALFQALFILGIPCEREGEYNRWAFYATMNMIWSGEWGVLGRYVPSDEEVRACAELAQSRLTDRDGMYSVRWYFRVDE